MSDYIPRDVLIDILIRLPIKTLVRCTSVCKSWYSLLTNPSFITTHLNHTTITDHNNNDSDSDLLIVRRYDKSLREEEYSLYFDNENFDEYAKLEFPLKTSRDYFNVIGCCNGLICLCDDLQDYKETLFLWNPSIRKSVALPRVRVGFGSHGPFSHIIGFGYDPLTNDYKVVRIVYVNGEIIPAEVDIFTVNTGTWRNISHLGLFYYILKRTHQAYLNCAAHWVAYDKRNEFCYLIVSFSMVDEVFREIKPPAIIACKNWLCYDVHAVNFQGSLSLFEGNLNSTSFCIWVMKEYGVAESWTKQMVIDLPGYCVMWVFGFRKNGDVLMASEMDGVVPGDDRGSLECYDPKGKQYKDLGIHCSIGNYYTPSFYSDAYKESLVLLGVTFCDTLACEGPPELHDRRRKWT